MRILVTGGGGFLGSAIIAQLHLEEHELVSFSRRRHPALERWGVKQVQGDITDADALIQACGNCDAVFHTAALPSLWGGSSLFHAINVVGTENVVRACRLNGVRKLIHTSSPSVILNGSDLNGVNEAIPYPTRYKAAYPETKGRAERVVLERRDGNLAVVVLRPHCLWGPGDRHFAPRVIARGGRMARLGRENKRVDFTYVDDAARAHVLALHLLEPGSGIDGKVYFITQDEPYPMWDFFNRILAIAGRPPVQRLIPPRMGYAIGWMLETAFRVFALRGEPPITRFLAEGLSTSHWFDISAAKADLGYAPQITMEEGFARFAVWWRSGRD